MYSILLIDDEKSIRENLDKVMPFEQHGFIVRSTASNGREALEKLPEICPDLILLDVRMPEMDGLEFLKLLRQGSFANTPVIMLSGFSEFEYAKGAMIYGVKAYLCKPVDEEEMGLILDKIRKELDLNQGDKILASNRDQLKELKKLYSGCDIDREIFKGYTLMTCIILSDNNYSGNNSHISFQDFISKQWGDFESYLFLSKGCRYTFLLPPKAFGTYQNDKRKFADNLLFALKSEKLECSLLFDSYIFENKENTFREDFSKHIYEMITEIFFEAKDYLDYQPNCFKMGEVLSKEANYLEKIRKHLLLMDNSEVQQDIGKLMEDVYSAHLGIYFVQEISYRIYYLIVEEISKYANITQVEPLLSQPNWMDYPYFITFSKWKEMQLSIIIKGLDFIQRGSKIAKLGIGKSVVEYVHTHYMEQICLKQIADMFFVNVTYLGRAFQKATGVSFNQYVNNIRIAEAKKLLLQTDMRIYEIASRVGYTESKYFVVKFIQEVGKSPTEFRNEA